MKVLFLGSIIKTEDCNKFLGPSVAGNKMQLGIIKTLKEHFKSDLDILTEIPIAAYPRSDKIFINKNNIDLTDKITAKKVPFINIFFFKQITLIINACIVICLWQLVNRKEKKVIICFNAFPYIALPALWISLFTKIKTICIFADPPIDVSNRNFFGKYFKYLEDNSFKKSIRKFDMLVVLNEAAARFYAPDSKYILLDGGFDITDLPLNIPGGQWLNSADKDPLRIVFSGGLFEYNGIRNLIESVQYLKNKNFQLEIYGRGPLIDFVKDKSISDSRIRYMHNVDNAEMQIIQQSSALLVNPRKTDDPISKYTFPSKMIEYLLSGTPVVSTKLNGYTSEYFDHMFLFEDDTPKAIAAEIDKILEMDSKFLISKAIGARDFIKTKKTWNIQTNKIIEAINFITGEQNN